MAEDLDRHLGVTHMEISMLILRLKEIHAIHAATRAAIKADAMHVVTENREKNAEKLTKNI